MSIEKDRTNEVAEYPASPVVPKRRVIVSEITPRRQSLSARAWLRLASFWPRSRHEHDNGILANLGRPAESRPRYDRSVRSDFQRRRTGPRSELRLLFRNEALSAASSKLGWRARRPCGQPVKQPRVSKQWGRRRASPQQKTTSHWPDLTGKRPRNDSAHATRRATNHRFQLFWGWPKTRRRCRCGSSLQKALRATKAGSAPRAPAISERVEVIFHATPLAGKTRPTRSSQHLHESWGTCSLWVLYFYCYAFNETFLLLAGSLAFFGGVWIAKGWVNLPVARIRESEVKRCKIIPILRHWRCEDYLILFAQSWTVNGITSRFLD